MFASARGKYHIYIRQLQSSGTAVLIISDVTFRDCRVHIVFPTTFLDIAVFQL